MLELIKPDKVLFLDIETVPQFAAYTDLPEKSKIFWEKKASYLAKEDQNAEELYKRAGIYAEFGRVVCVSFGKIQMRDGQRFVRLKSIFNHNETQLLTEFADLLNRLDSGHDLMLCAHNGKEFDFPYLSRRMLINGIRIPKVLDVSGRKPWETSFIDTMELWKFGDFKNYTSLDLLTHIFGIPSPKADIDGSKVAHVYWHENDLPRIAAYCQNDVLAIVQLFLKFRGEEIIPADRIEVVA